MIKLIASDMDGTLLNDEHTISEENIKAIKIAEERGCHFTIVTGRDYSGVKNFFQEFDLKCECILSNGAEYRDINGDVIERITIDNDTVRKIVQVMMEANVAIEMFTEDGMIIINEDIYKESLLQRFRRYNKGKTDLEIIEIARNMYDTWKPEMIKDVEGFLDSNTDILKIMTYHEDAQYIKELKEKLKNIEGVAVASTFANDIEISNIQAQKGLILAKVIEKMGIKKEEVIVLGDSFNDYSMFTEFENSFAMENAIPEIKEIAKYITDSNDNDGVAKAIYKALEWK
ncbi:Cof-type HAD-IIB family hydrolase [Clostridium celatum]|nr:Cof-type HAD-IIB family hydrolase [Clostridium celatum]MCE9655547.1 Cof-type HAD-IIB family hydrolase [Clostridium celatum]MDU2265932.1 Cof-type HAD-IIB family hydrolase [Clostridium celatum]MDU3723853.1 Cof-type HAD-IIB family hydrolase [Clostridium celatum]MDU6296230.1 Cof-type HAD-IIB family hydrolase [Clostridium celatum]MDY3362264.1 Cof-type HAD-IIB family hydrolase [Clostridium celatum]